jgi:CheY-like chemotaxis protein
VVTNLVMNAVQAAPGGTVRLAAARSGASLCVRVDDDGPGLAPDVLARLFEPFFTTKPVGMGTGLGLSVSLGIVERHGGTLAAENRTPPDPPGARFTVTLPLAPRPTDAEQPDAPAGDARPAGAAADSAVTAEHELALLQFTRPHGRPPRVLVVDDEGPNRQALGRFFGRRGCAVDEAADGRAAFARLLDAEAVGAPYDLVLSDVRMAGVSGIVLHDWLARTHPALLDRLVFATGDVASPEVAAFVERTRCLVLDKPFEPGALDALARRMARTPADVR